VSSSPVSPILRSPRFWGFRSSRAPVVVLQRGGGTHGRGLGRGDRTETNLRAENLGIRDAEPGPGSLRAKKRGISGVTAFRPVLLGRSDL